MEVIRDERTDHANTATRVGNAFLMLLDYIAGQDSPYIRKDQEDTTAFLLRMVAGAVIGESGQIKLNPDGSITCGRINVEGSAIFHELVINHQNVLEGDTYFTDRGIIEGVEDLGEGQLRLTMRKTYDAEKITFHAYDVLKCAMNNLDANRTFKTSWMRVDSVDNTNGTMDVTLYDNEDVPGGRNYAPAPSARVIRWGNQADASRQSVFFISSKDGRFLFLQGVTQPKIDDTNYSAFVGLPPSMECLEGIQINQQHPYLYARGLIVQDLIHVDYEGNPTYTARDLGFWDEERQYIHGYDEEAKGYYTDRVWWGGCLWQCAVSEATVGKEPRYNNADWVCLIGGKNMSMEITSTNGDSFRAGTHWETTLVCELWNAEMKLTEEEIGLSHITWQRISGDTPGDVAWNVLHAANPSGLELEIDSEEDVGTWEAGSKVAFQCEIQLPETGESYLTGYEIYM